MKQINKILSDIQQLANVEHWHIIDKDLALQHIRLLYTEVLNIAVSEDAIISIANEHAVAPTVLNKAPIYTGQGYYEGANKFSNITINDDDFKKIPLVNAVSANDLAEEQPLDEIEIITPHNLEGLSEEISSAFALQNDITLSESVMDTAGVVEKYPQEELLTIQEIEAAFNQEIHNNHKSHISIELPEQRQMGTEENVTKAPTPIAFSDDDDAFYDKLRYLAKPKPSIGQSFITPQHVKQKDIRNAIGLNDKYLFLNELFNNDKEAYDIAISKINNIEHYEDAIQWIDQHLKQDMKWDVNDSTVTTFYGLLEKHFNLM